MKLKYFVLLGLFFTLSACAGKSDSLGLVENEQTKTYAEAYMPARQALLNGTCADIVKLLDANAVNEDGDKVSREDLKEKLIAKNSELAIIERGLIALNCGDVEKALLYFDAAELKMNLTEEEHKAKKMGSALAKGGFAALLGTEEVRDYEMRGYEKVMLLNYKALCYVLLGDRKAYNVTRKAIDKQQEEWEKFKVLLAEFEAKREKENAQADKIAKEVDVDDRDEETKKKASLVPNAYVNPFGDYINALLMEMDGIDDRTIRDNARIAYNNVLDNNKECYAAKEGAKNVRRGIPRGYKLVHVILADGFSPERKEVQKGFQIDKLKAVVNFANATPIDSNVQRARVRYSGRVTNLSSLSKMESIILRDEQDRMPFRATMIALALLRSGTASAFLGDLGVSLAATLQRPDTRSWLTLPNKVIVARLIVPNKTKNITLETLDKKGKVLAKTDVAIAERGPTVVYGVSYETNLKAFANKHSWIKNK